MFWCLHAPGFHFVCESKPRHACFGEQILPYHLRLCADSTETHLLIKSEPKSEQTQDDFSVLETVYMT